MKKLISLVMTLALLTSCLSGLAVGYEVETKTLEHNVLGTLNTSGADYEGRIRIHNYIGTLRLDLPVGDETEEAEVAVVLAGADPVVEVELRRFSGHIYPATLSADEYHYNGKSFQRSEEKAGSGASDKSGGSLTPGATGGLYSGRVYFYYSIEDLGYASVDEIPDDKWRDLFWFNLGSTYLLSLEPEDVSAFMSTGELEGFGWPGLRELLAAGSTEIPSGFENFRAVLTYAADLFTDVEGRWYTAYVSRVYEYGLMNGKGGGVFAPAGTMTVAEALTLCARLHSIYRGGDGRFEQGDLWYQVYVGYLAANGVAVDGFDSYDRAVTRREMARLMVAAVDITELEAINSAVTIPDVPESDGDYDAIVALYRAGVLTGGDEEGSFFPEREITRAEVSAIAARLVCPELRVEK